MPASDAASAIRRAPWSKPWLTGLQTVMRGVVHEAAMLVAQLNDRFRTTTSIACGSTRCGDSRPAAYRTATCRRRRRSRRWRASTDSAADWWRARCRGGREPTGPTSDGTPRLRSIERGLRPLARGHCGVGAPPSNFGASATTGSPSDDRRVQIDLPSHVRARRRLRCRRLRHGPDDRPAPRARRSRLSRAQRQRSTSP